ncbi:actin-like ATPase domain-containing protein [Mycena rebaudengoi]|nr:actin-like ATPase domain-containing protein [Mycena rebaudengoi]
MLCCREERRATPTSNAVSGHRRYIIDQEPGPQPVPLFHHPSLHAAHQGPRPSPPLDYSSSQYDGSPAAANAHAIPSITVDHEGKLVIAIDFGTTFSGVAYRSSRIASGNVQQVLNWPGSSETFRKARSFLAFFIPTCLLYDEQGQVLAWGLEAKNASPMHGTSRYEWFKLFLDPRALRDDGQLDPRLPLLPDGQQPTELITAFLSCLWEYAREQITRDIGAIADLNSAEIYLTVPASWDVRGTAMMRTCALEAGLVQRTHAGDTAWRERLKILTEPEAAAVHCAAALGSLRRGQRFIVCDAGGGTVDLAVYQIIGKSAPLEIAEVAARAGANCGSLFLDLRFRALVRRLLADHPAHLDPPSLAYFMHSFSEADKLNYAGGVDDETTFYFTCFNPIDPDDSAIGLENGQLSISGRTLREEVFDPVIDEVLSLIHKQLSALETPPDALLLVGGFAGCEYLKQRIEETFPTTPLTRPPDADSATLRGAASFRTGGTHISRIVVGRSYAVKATLPATPEDFLHRPAYIRTNAAGIQVCSNRLQYLVRRGTVVRRGEHIPTRFWSVIKFEVGHNE